MHIEGLRPYNSLFDWQKVMCRRIWLCASACQPQHFSPHVVAHGSACGPHASKYCNSLRTIASFL